MRRRTFLKAFIGVLAAAAAPKLLKEPAAEGKLLSQPVYLHQEFPGQSYRDAGYVYAPYIPLYTTPTVMVDDFIESRGLATHYGKKAINQDFYATRAL